MQANSRMPLISYTWDMRLGKQKKKNPAPCKLCTNPQGLSMENLRGRARCLPPQHDHVHAWIRIYMFFCTLTHVFIYNKNKRTWLQQNILGEIMIFNSKDWQPTICNQPPKLEITSQQKIYWGFYKETLSVALKQSILVLQLSLLLKLKFSISSEREQKKISK